jgi:hypothetical protein
MSNNKRSSRSSSHAINITVYIWAFFFRIVSHLEHKREIKKQTDVGKRRETRFSRILLLLTIGNKSERVRIVVELVRYEREFSS